VTWLYYVVGITLAILAVLVSFLGLRSERFGQGRSGALLALVFVLLVATTAAGAVINARHEHKKHAAEYREYKAKHSESE
jgi:multisubunit Na+/H+ antiporter MnhG subunit